MVRLKHLASLRVKCASNGERPYVALEHIASWTGALIAGTELPVRTPSRAGMASVEPGDVLFGKLRPYLAKTWVVDRPALASTELMCMRPRAGIESRWLGYSTMATPFVEWAVSTSEGTKMPRTSWEKIGEYRPWVPSRPEQRVIADYLDIETGRIDALISKKRRMIELLEERLATRTDALIWQSEGQLTPLMRLVPPSRKIMYGIVLPGPDVDNGVLLVKGGDVKPGRLQPSRLSRTTRTIDASYARSRLRPDDLIFAIRGGVGDVEIVPPELAGANITQDVARISPNAGVSMNWLLYALRSPSTQRAVEKRITGATIRGINIWDLERVRIPVPDVVSQQESAAELKDLDRRYSAAVAALARQIDLLAERRQALVTAAVTGELAVQRGVE